MFPVTVMNLMTYVLFEPLESMTYALSGSLLSASVTYGLGELLGRNVVRKLAGNRLNRLSQKIAEQGILAMTALRIVPIAPFTIINLAAGASHIRFKDYLIGTFLGMFPGIFMGSILGYRLMTAILQPSLANIGIFIGILLATALVYLFIRLLYKRI